jgi:phage gp46-like protein
MSDLRIKEYRSLEGVTMDYLMLDSGILDEREELATAVRVALGTDALSGEEEILPDPDSTDRKGWWGDLDADIIWGGWPIGCKNWLLTRAKITDTPSVEGSTIERARRYTRDALQPFIDKKVCTRIDVNAVKTELQRIEVNATIYRGPFFEVDLRYQLLWQEEPAFEPNVVIKNTLIRVPFRKLTISSVAPNKTVGILLSPMFNIVSANLQISTNAPTVSQNIVRQPPQGNLARSSIAPIITIGMSRTPLQGNLALSTVTPVINSNIVKQPPSGNIAISSVALILTPGIRRDPLQGNGIISSTAPTVSVGAGGAAAMKFNVAGNSQYVPLIEDI